MTTTSAKTLLTLTLLLAMLGCARTNLSPQQPKLDHFRPQQVNISSQDSLRDVIVFSPIVTDYKGGSLHIEVPLRSTTDFDVIVDYRFSYFDDSHRLIDSPSGWQTKMLHSNIFETITSDAPSPQARDFQLDLRSAQ